MMRLLCASILALFVVVAPPAAAETVTREDCARLVAHVASADVAYQPGVDVNGNAVASADLDDEGGRIGNFDATAGIGAVTFRNGVVHFNGRPLSSPEARRLAAACGSR